MDAGALAAIPVIVAGVLLLSGLLKVGDRQATADSLVALRVPFADRLGWFAAWQPWLEVGLGLAVLALPGWGFLAAGWLVAVFFGVLTVIVARAASRPDQVHCNCFGAASTEPVGWATVLRNLVLTAASLLVALGATGSDGPVVEAAHFDTQSVTWLVAITAGAVAFGLLWFENRRLARRLHAVRPGAGVPDSATRVASPRNAGRPDLALVPDLPASAPLDVSDAELVTVAGDVETVRDLAAGHALLLVFVQLECHACSLVVAALPEWTASLEPAVRVRIATSATPAALAGAYPEAAPGALHGARGIRTALGIEQVPAAVLIGRDLTVAAGPVLGPDEIEALVGGIQSALRF